MDKKKAIKMMASLKSMQKDLSDYIGQSEDPNMDDVDNPDESLLEDSGYTVDGNGDENEAVPDAGDGAIGMDKGTEDADEEKTAKKSMLVAMMKKKMR